MKPQRAELDHGEKLLVILALVLVASLTLFVIAFGR